MKTQNKRTTKRLKLAKETVTILTKEQQWKLLGGNVGDIKGGEAKTSGIGG